MPKGSRLRRFFARLPGGRMRGPTSLPRGLFGSGGARPPALEVPGGNGKKRSPADVAFRQFLAGEENGRDEAFGIAVVFRCLSLLSGMIAQQLSGHLGVRNRANFEITSPEIQRVLDAWFSSLDGDLPSYTTAEELATDYLTDGNGLLWHHKDLDSYTRLLPWSAEFDERTQMYHASTSGEMQDEVEVPAEEVIHIRWGQVLEFGNTLSDRGPRFAVSPLAALASALSTARVTDFRVMDRAAKKTQHRIFYSAGQPVDEEMLGEFAGSFQKFTEDDGEYPMLLSGAGAVASMRDPAMSPETLQLRIFLIREISRIYGVPSVLLHEEVNNWGRAIEEIGRLFWQTGLRQHMDRFLEPMSLRLLPRGMKFVADPFDLIKGNIQAQAQYIELMRGDGQRSPLATIDEIREKSGLPAATPEIKEGIEELFNKNRQAQREQGQAQPGEEESGTMPAFPDSAESERRIQ